MIKTIAIFRTGGIGDVILSTVSINIIKDQLPGAKIIWFGREPVNSLIKNTFKDVEVYEISSTNSYLQNLAVIKNSSKQIHALIDLQHSARTIILARLAAIYFKCTYTSWNKYSIERSLLVLQAKVKGRKFKSDLFKKELPNRYQAMAACTLKALDKLSVKKIVNKEYTPSFYFPEKEKGDSSIAICLGAKFLLKALPMHVIENLIEAIIQYKEVYSIYLLGEENQKQNGESIIKKFAARIKIINACGTTTLTQAAAILRQSKFAIVNDSGLAHLAEAVATPVLMFFGPTHQKFGYRPYLKNSKTISVALGCRPCHKNGDTHCRYNDHACSALISVAEISKVISEMENV